jgi:hypothetical protein
MKLGRVPDSLVITTDHITNLGTNINPNIMR